jgi:hypothetical protein
MVLGPKDPPPITNLTEEEKNLIAALEKKIDHYISKHPAD